MTDDAAGGEDEEGVEVGEEGVVLEGQEGNPIPRVQRCSPRVKKKSAQGDIAEKEVHGPVAERLDGLADRRDADRHLVD